MLLWVVPAQYFVGLAGLDLYRACPAFALNSTTRFPSNYYNSGRTNG